MTHSEETVFAEALEKHDLQERAAYLDEACAGDPSLRAEVEALLSAYDTGEFLESPVAVLPETLDEAVAIGRPGAVLGPYKLLEQIGEGAFGLVFLAEQQHPVRRQVAVKVLKPGMDSRQIIARFEAERQALALMDHPNIARVLDAGETASGRPYFVMELVRGVAITNYCDQHNLNVRERLELFVTVCQAVQHAHQKGIIHRDIKPSNVMVTRHDDGPMAKVIDFGIAKALGQQLTDKTLYTGAAQLIGTPLYMSPEQAALSNVDVDTRSDIYSLGVLLYELLTGTTPFDRERLKKADYEQIRRIIREEEPPRLRALDPSVPRDLETIVLKCLAKEREQRYATAAALAEDLRRFLADRPILARRSSRRERLWRLCRRNPAIASLLTTVAVLVLMVAIGSTYAALRLTSALGKTQQAEREGRLREAEALIGKAHGIRYSRRSGQRFEALAALEKAAAIGWELGQPTEWFDWLRNEAIAALALPDIHITHSWNGFPSGSKAAALSNDFELYARTTEQGDCSIRRVADDVEIAHLPESGELTIPSFGPGRLLLVKGKNSGRCQLWDLTGPEPVRRFDEQHYVDGFAFRSDGALIALGHVDSMSVYETDTGNRRHLLASKGLPFGMLALHPSAPFVAICSYSSNLLQVRDLQNGAVLVSLTLPWRGSSNCTWSPDGQTLAVAEGDRGRVHLYAFDPANASLRLTHELQGPSNGGTSIRFNPVGDRLAAVGWNGLCHIFDVATGRLLFSTNYHWFCDESFQFDPTGQQLSLARVGANEDQLGIFSIADAREYRALLCDGGRQYYGDLSYKPAIHPGGRLAVAGLNDGLGLWDLQTGRQVAFVKIARGVGNVAFDGGGNLLANTWAGCFRWPVHAEPTKPERLTIGPPERLAFPTADRDIAANGNGQVIAQATWGAGGWVLSTNLPKPRRTEPHDRVACTDVSPDGHFVAFGAHNLRVTVYEAETGRCVWQSPADNHCYCRFSRHGQWLVTDNDGVRAYRVGSWEAGPRLGPGVPWDISPDNRFVILGLPDGVYRLVELATGRELARLEDPEQIAAHAVFTPDGTRLVSSATDGLRIWDLRRIRAELTKLDLDWDAPAYPAAPDREDAPPLQVTVDLGDPDPAKVRAFEEARAANNQAWLLATNPDTKQRDPARAAELAQKAVDLAPKQAMYWNTLGVAHYRAGHWKDAIEALTKSMELQKGAMESFDTFFLAMAHWQQGEKEKARQYYDRAVQWMDKNQQALEKCKPHQEELRRFRVEAAELLSIKEKTTHHEDKKDPKKKP